MIRVKQQPLRPLLPSSSSCDLRGQTRDRPMNLLRQAIGLRSPGCGSTTRSGGRAGRGGILGALGILGMGRKRGRTPLAPPRPPRFSAPSTHCPPDKPGRPEIFPHRGKLFHTVENRGETGFHCVEKCPKPASIVWKNFGNMFPLRGKTPETFFHCVETFPLPSRPPS